MNDTECVRTFMQAMQPDQVASMPGLAVKDEHRLLRARLVLSEALELCAALGVVVFCESDVRYGRKGYKVTTDDDLHLEVVYGVPVDHVEAADACADLRYVVVGTEVALGIPGDAVFAEVHRSNMMKLDPATGRPVVDAGGKVQKPPGWTPPDVAGVLARHLEETRT